MHSRVMNCVCCMLTIIDFSSILFIHVLVCLPWEFVKVYHNIVYGPGACHLLYWFKNLTRMANIMQLGHKQCYHKLEQILRGLYVIDKPPPQVFTPELSCVLPVNTNGGWFDWLVLLQAYKLLLCFLPLPCSLFYQTGTLCQATSGSGSLVLLLVLLQTSRQSLHAFRAPWPSSVLLPEMLSWASSDSGSLCPCCWHWQLYWSRGEWIIWQVPRCQDRARL